MIFATRRAAGVRQALLPAECGLVWAVPCDTLPRLLLLPVVVDLVGVLGRLSLTGKEQEAHPDSPKDKHYFDYPPPCLAFHLLCLSFLRPEVLLASRGSPFRFICSGRLTLPSLSVVVSYIISRGTDKSKSRIVQTGHV